MRGHFLATLSGGLIGGFAVLCLQGTMVRAQPVVGETATNSMNLRELNIVDSRGKVRMSMRCDSNNAPRLRFLNDIGQMRAVVGLGNNDNNENPFIYLVDNNQVKANMSLAPDGAPTIYLNGQDGKPRVFMCAAPAPGGDGDISQMVVYGNERNLRTEIISAGGRSGLSTYKQNKMRTYSGIMPEGVSGFLANDQSGEPATIDGITAGGKRLLVKLKPGQHMDLEDRKKTTRLKMVK